MNTINIFKKQSIADGLPTIDHYFVGTDFINACKGKLPNSELKHLGFGEFELAVAERGSIFFWRMDKKIDGIVGRQHRMTDNRDDYLITILMDAMAIKIVEL